MNFNVGGYLKNRFEQASRCNDQYKDTGMTWIEKLIKSLENKHHSQMSMPTSPRGNIEAIKLIVSCVQFNKQEFRPPDATHIKK